MKNRFPYVVLIGKTNVGKSTLFNRIVGKRKAIVERTPNITRDLIEDIAEWEGEKFMLVDSGGFVDKPHDEIEMNVRSKLIEAIERADLLIVMVDGRSEITKEDFDIADMVRRSGKRYIFVINKMENIDMLLNPDIYALGLSEPIRISAEHGINVDELLDRIVSQIESKEETEPRKVNIRVSIVGKPNVGKSTLFNAIIKEDKSIVTDIPGTTRDVVHSLLERNGNAYLFLDTAGLRKKAKVGKKGIERYSVKRTLNAVRESDIVSLLIDPTQGVTEQDQRISSFIQENKKAVIIVISKSDIMNKKELGNFIDFVKHKLYFLDYAPIISVSAKTGKGLSKLFHTIDTVYKNYTFEVSTNEINNVLRRIMLISPVSTSKGKRVRISYCVQGGIKPPKFIFFCNYPGAISDQFKAHIEHMMRKNITPLSGTPIHLIFRRG